MYTKFWKVMNGDTAVNITFITKKDALGWIAKQDTPENFTVKKMSMN